MSNTIFAIVAALHLSCAILAGVALHFFATSRAGDSSHWILPAFFVAVLSVIGMFQKAPSIVRLSFAPWLLAWLVFVVRYMLLLSIAQH
jgi:hypothetical protein